MLHVGSCANGPNADASVATGIATTPTVGSVSTPTTVIANATPRQSTFCVHMGGVELEYTEKDVARFHMHINKSSGCWLWLAAKDKDGYGFFHLKGKLVKAHRFMWQLINGPIPLNNLICHHCDNPPCVRPDHLFAGTLQDNKDDQKRKGRTTIGERNPSAKLTADQVREIRFLAETTNITQQALANKFGIQQAYVSRILRNHTWWGI